MLTRDHVIWCYRILLGRDPEDEAVITDKLQRLKAIKQLRDEFVSSPEFSSSACRQRRQSTPVSDQHREWAWRIFIGRAPELTPDGQPVDQQEAALSHVDALIDYLRQTPSKFAVNLFAFEADTRILILGNCQTDLLAPLLAHRCGCQVENIREHILTDASQHATILKQVNRADVVISHPLSTEAAGPFQTECLRERIAKLLIIPSLYFSGLHPDLIYVGPLGRRYASPLGDYHSAIALAAFLEGVSPDNTLALFRNPDLFDQAGFFQEWQNSLNELRRRESYCDMTLSEEISQGILERPLFYSVNHPTLELLNLTVKKIIRQLGKPDKAEWCSFWRDELQTNVIYPVWGPISDHHQLPYRSPEMFFVPSDQGGTLDLPAYIHQVFSQYTQDLPHEAAAHPKVVTLRAVMGALM